MRDVGPHEVGDAFPARRGLLAVVDPPLPAGDVLEPRRADSLIEELDAIEIIRRRGVAEDPLTARTKTPRPTRANAAFVLALVLIRLRKRLVRRGANRQLERKRSEERR